MNIDVQYFKQPSVKLRLMETTGDKLKRVAQKLQNGYLYLPDEIRKEKSLAGFMSWLCSPRKDGGPWNILYEVPDFHGIIGFVDIIPAYKCDLLVYLWDKLEWGPTLERDVRTLLARFMKEYEIQRIGYETADPRCVRWALRAGFRQEGTKAVGFRHNGELYTTVLLRRLLRPSRRG